MTWTIVMVTITTATTVHYGGKMKKTAFHFLHGLSSLKDGLH